MARRGRTVTPAPAPAPSKFKEALIKYLEAETNLSRRELTHLSKTGAQLTRRRAGQGNEDTVVKRYFPQRVRTFQDMFKGAVGRPRYLTNGVYGIAFLVRYPGMTAPVVIKFSETPKTGGCRDGVLCTVVDGVPLRYYDWVGGLSTDRERKISELVSDIEADRESPHFVHAFTTKSVAIEQQCSLRDIAVWAGAPKAKVDRFEGSRVHTMSASVLEWGGREFEDITKRVVSKMGDAEAVAVLRSFMVQAMQGLTAMTWGDLHHNDLHTGNVLGSLTNAPYLHYEAVVHGTDGKVAPVYIRVPTHGVLWRIIDFGMATSSEEFGKSDHGLMARVADGGPRWDNGVLHRLGPLCAMPVEVYDLARLLSYVYADVGRCSSTVRTTIRRDILGIAAAAVKFAKGHRDTMSIAEVQRFRDVPKATFSNPVKARALQRDVAAASRAMADHGCMLHLFLRTAAAFGFELPGGDDTFQPTNAFTVEGYVAGIPSGR
jgi:hypothetical protein